MKKYFSFASGTLRAFLPEIRFVQIDAVRENTHTHVQLHGLLVEQRCHSLFHLIQPAIQIGLH